jgi:hypothetical protein
VFDNVTFFKTNTSPPTTTLLLLLDRMFCACNSAFDPLMKIKELVASTRSPETFNDEEMFNVPPFKKDSTTQQINPFGPT